MLNFTYLDTPNTIPLNLIIIQSIQYFPFTFLIPLSLSIVETQYNIVKNRNSITLPCFPFEFTDKKIENVLSTKSQQDYNPQINSILALNVPHDKCNAIYND